MLTFLSRSLRGWFDSESRREPASPPRAVPQVDELAAELARLRAAWQRAQQRAADELAARDIPIAPAAPVAAPVGATAFVAGQGARIYSLDVFRQRRNVSPPTHSAA